MNFPVIVKDCREFKYKDKKGVDKVGYSVSVLTENFETFAVFSPSPFIVNESAVFVISSGQYSKPFIYLERLRQPDLPFSA